MKCEKLKKENDSVEPEKEQRVGNKKMIRIRMIKMKKSRGREKKRRGEERMV